MPEERYLPDREIAYNYTAAMQFAQHFEDNLRGILHTIDWAFSGLDESLTTSETQRFRTFDRFKDKATLGTLKTKLIEVGLKLLEKAWLHIDKAITLRNELAHKYLINITLPAPNGERHEAITKELQRHALFLYQAMMISETALERLEERSNRQHEVWNEFQKEFGIEPSEINEGLWKNWKKKKIKQ